VAKRTAKHSIRGWCFATTNSSSRHSSSSYSIALKQADTRQAAPVIAASALCDIRAMGTIAEAERP